MAEALVTKNIKDYLDGFKKHEMWYWKVSDKYTSGIPDFIGCFGGILFGIEAKDAGEKPSKIQSQVSLNIRRAGGQTLLTDNIHDVKVFIKKLRHRAEMTRRYSLKTREAPDKKARSNFP